MNLNKRQKRVAALAAGLAIAALAASYFIFFATLTSAGTQYLYIDRDDTPDSLHAKVRGLADGDAAYYGYRAAALLLNCEAHFVPGRYAVRAGDGGFKLARKLRGHHREVVKLTIPVVRTTGDMAERLSQKLMADSAAFAAVFSSDSLLSEWGFTRETLPCLFLPFTYEVHWDIEPIVLMRKLRGTYEKYWNAERRKLAAEAGLTPVEAATLASIVEQETADNGERPMIAGMYLNRLRAGMKLQADPTVKFALGNFALRRILHEHLAADSPYNTYRHEGLPPGPICVPSIQSIEAVLHFSRHDYLYMCAKEDFSGTHNFAATYGEHLANAARYAAALNERGIK